MNRNLAVAVVLVMACKKPATSTTDAGVEVKPSASSSASIATDEEEDEGLDAGAATTCPRPLHPDYCRHNCRGFASRSQTKHARRVDPSERIAFGKCADMDVFAEDQYVGDGGLKSGIVEYFDDAGVLVGAVDTRVKPCGQFGTVPTCAPALAWEDSRTFTLHIDPIESTQLPPEVINRILRQNFGRFRACASSDVKGPRVVGSVVAKVAIAKDGSVTSAKDDGSDLADKKVTTCVINAMQHMSFPEPKSAMTVRIPLVFRH